ncbi:MAG: peptide-methionine (S)-S-oxide reductase MsrA [Candidatus Kerfeldbacteria bacterium]|nr:peptide-methionine (S)-S-oxide reductase MsrA [Candidatus Kerfeldbacteria bacterium]
MPTATQLATFGSGCFWCTEAIFRDLNGVLAVTSGYAGGTVPNPTYEQICGGQTGHAEVVQVEFDPAAISYSQLVEIFFLTHDPTTMNRQGNDVGEQYRSVIFYHSDAQRSEAEAVRQRLVAERVYDQPIVTALAPFTHFYPAEVYHQQYYANNPDQAYCQMVINPKVTKFRKKFAHLLKSTS